MESSAPTLHIPQGINYECQSCGKCCGGWAVPMTEADYDRISDVDWQGVSPLAKASGLYRELKKYESANTPYTHKIVSDTGVCPFLVDKLCHIHAERGMQFKPTICQLFPYCFTETPSGVYATVSFVSEGVVYNAGRPLADQPDQLQRKWAEFRSLYPDYKPDWSHTRLTVDKPISWDEYMRIEEQLLARLNDTSKRLEQRLWECSLFLRAQLSGGTVPADAPKLEDAPPMNALDKSVLAIFHRMYFPAKPTKQGDGDFKIARFVGEHFMGGKRIHMPGESFSLSELVEFPFSDDPEVYNLLYRYVFSYVYGKKYFGAGFGQVSLIPGFHHIILMLAMVKLHSKAVAKSRGAHTVGMLDVAATVRQLERMVGETKLDGYSAAVWEMLLGPGTRARRLLAHV